MTPVRLQKMCAYFLLGSALVISAGCRAATEAFGGNVMSAKTHAAGFASAMEQRFTRVTRSAKVSNARMRLGRYAFAPSKLANDTAIWTSMHSAATGAERRLDIVGTMEGTLADGNYAFTPGSRTSRASRVGDSHHFIGLTQISNDNEWQWSTTVENAIGAMPAAQASQIFRALFVSAERSPTVVRADYRGAAPRTTTALARLVTIDSLQTVTQSDGSINISIGMLLSDTRLKGDFPEFAKYVGKYLEPAKMHVRLTDKSGAEWFTIRMNKLRITLQFRSRDGELQPLLGADRAMPDTLQLRIDGSTKLSFFTVGITNLRGQFVHVHTPTDNAWAMRFTEEPEWHLPLIAERLLSSPLKRPFAGEGVVFRIGLGAGQGGQTVLYRQASAVVQESAIMRFLGNLGFTAMSDFAGKVEEEENQFIAEWFRAFRADISSLTMAAPSP